MPEPARITRVIPSGQPLPTAPPPGPPVPYGTFDPPPWRPVAPPPPPVIPPQAPPPPPWATAPPPGPIEVYVTLGPPAPAPEPEPEGRDWSWLTRRIRPWASVVSAVVVLGPWFGGRSMVGAWSTAMHDARTEAGILPAYLIAGAALGLTFYADAFFANDRRPRWWTRGALIVALVGGTGAIGWFDPVTLLTGVRP
ncbi:hypothetical protein [Streptomyces sp. NRRL S-337]|uniref:hypothetical protein n=1 Tax=Streptomyces sp. NRRL S-337 TaxID=1463900 RepID=UPI0004CC60C2|nr:hypothetical protein [Streptomyces sp. NRRL S-337]